MLSRSAFVSRNVGFGFGRSCLRSTVRAAGGAIEERQRSRARSFATDPSGSAPIVGCGSNVVDLFYRVKELPKPGDKGYFSFASPLVDTVVGGVTLNHLCWARALGAPTGLMALQGEDDNGRTIRAALKERDVSTSTVRVSPEYGTSVSHVFVDDSGERAIIMAPAATSLLARQKMEAEFAAAVAGATLVTSEISQVPLTGVEYLLDATRATGGLSVLDVDVPVDVATGAANLGTADDVRSCVTKCDVLKLTFTAAAELLDLASPQPLSSSLAGAAEQLAKVYDKSLVVITDGSNGSAWAVGRGETHPAVHIPVFEGVKQVDATGAGDAFCGGLVASLWHWGIPTSVEQLERFGRLASVAGAACCEVLGALPVPGVSDARMCSLEPSVASLVEAAKVETQHEQQMEDTAGTSEVAGAVSSLDADLSAMKMLSGAYTADVALVHSVAKVGTLMASAAKSGKHVFATGIGKSGSVASRLAISLASVGVPAQYVQGSEWVHGDLGSLREGDVVIAVSHSGTTTELLEAVSHFRSRGVKLIALVGDSSSPLAADADGVLVAPAGDELLKKVPTRSLVAQHAVANALLTETTRALGFTASDFVRHHPGGAIGASK